MSLNKKLNRCLQIYLNLENLQSFTDMTKQSKSWKYDEFITDLSKVPNWCLGNEIDEK
jgi:hypothetical protein